MDREKIASELLKLAKSLVSESPERTRSAKSPVDIQGKNHDFAVSLADYIEYGEDRIKRWEREQYEEIGSDRRENVEVSEAIERMNTRIDLADDLADKVDIFRRKFGNT